MAYLELKDFNISSNTGFLPEHPSTELPGNYFREWEKAARNLPQLISSKTVKDVIDLLPEREFTMTTLSTEAEWRRAYMLVSFLAQAYTSEVAEVGKVMKLPQKLSVPWHATSKHIGILPAATYAAIVMYNYTLKDPAKPLEEENLQAAMTFTGTKEESWFYMIHILEEIAAAPGLDAIVTAYKAISSNDRNSLAQSLKVIAETLHSMKLILRRMYEHCNPAFFYNTLRPLLSFPESGMVYSGVSSDVIKYCSVSGAQDSAIPAFSIFLGTRNGAHEQELVERFKLYMPAKHREFLESLGKQPSVNGYVQGSGDAELVKQYDAAVDALTSFRSRHISLVTSYIINVKQRQGERISTEDKGTGGTPNFMQFLKKVRDNTHIMKTT